MKNILLFNFLLFSNVSILGAAYAKPAAKVVGTACLSLASGTVAYKSFICSNKIYKKSQSMDSNELSLGIGAFGVIAAGISGYSARSAAKFVHAGLKALPK